MLPAPRPHPQAHCFSDGDSRLSGPSPGSSPCTRSSQGRGQTDFSAPTSLSSSAFSEHLTYLSPQSPAPSSPAAAQTGPAPATFAPQASDVCHPYPPTPPFQKQLLISPSTHLPPASASQGCGFALVLPQPPLPNTISGSDRFYSGDSCRFSLPHGPSTAPAAMALPQGCAQGVALRPASGSREFPPHRGGL